MAERWVTLLIGSAAIGIGGMLLAEKTLNSLPGGPQSPGAPPLATHTAVPTETCFDYVTQPGDTLWGIGRKYGVSHNKIDNDNPTISDPDILTIGMTLQVCR